MEFPGGSSGGYGGPTKQLMDRSTRRPEASASCQVANRQIDASPIGQMLAALEETANDQWKLIASLEDRLRVVLAVTPRGEAGNAAKAPEPITVLERLQLVNDRLRYAQQEVADILSRLQV